MTIEEKNEPKVSIHIYGEKMCVDGKPHDDDGEPYVNEEQRVGSVRCSRCGSLAIDRAMFDEDMP